MCQVQGMEYLTQQFYGHIVNNIVNNGTSVNQNPLTQNLQNFLYVILPYYDISEQFQLPNT